MAGFLARNYAGAVIVLAMLLGGGSRQGIWTDHLIAFSMLPALFVGLRDYRQSRLAPAAQLLLGVIILLVLAQLLPWHRTISIGGAEFSGWGLLSPLPLASLEAALVVIPLASFALYLSRLDDAAQARCLNFVMIGFFANFVAGLVQLASGMDAIGVGFMPYDIRAGLFANENHFATLTYIMIPLIAWVHLAQHRRPLIYLVFVALIVSFLFAFGSRAGMAISLTLALLCLLWFLAPRVGFRIKAALLLAGMALLALALWLAGLAGTLQEDLRSVFFATTLRAIADHWLTGSGLGTFTAIYPSYEAREATINVYANHAHNDYLEIVLETGILGGLLIALYFALILRHAGRSLLTQAAFIAIAAIALHSLVDYPLRTFGVAVPFIWLSVLVLSSRKDGSRPRRLPSSQPDFVAHRETEPEFS